MGTRGPREVERDLDLEVEGCMRSGWGWRLRALGRRGVQRRSWGYCSVLICGGQKGWEVYGVFQGHGHGHAYGAAA